MRKAFSCLTSSWFTFFLSNECDTDENNTNFLTYDIYYSLVHSWGAYSSSLNYRMLFNNPNFHRTIESLVMTCLENGRDLFQANVDSLFYGKFCGLWTKEYLFGKHESILCLKCEKRLGIPDDDVVACLKSQNTDWIPLSLAIWNIMADRM